MDSNRKQNNNNKNNVALLRHKFHIRKRKLKHMDRRNGPMRTLEFSNWPIRGKETICRLLPSCRVQSGERNFLECFFNDLRIYLDRSMILWLNVLEWFKNLFQGEYDFVIKDLSVASYVFLGDWYLLLDFILVLFLVKNILFCLQQSLLLNFPFRKIRDPFFFMCFIASSGHLHVGPALGWVLSISTLPRCVKKYQACTFCHKYLQKKA